jgi:lipid II:glycine glycyltransferase (peptidoglycan interpeptide bridge formation enzyme)
VSLTVREAGSAEREAWDAFVAAVPEGDILQAWAWGEAWRPEGELPVRLCLVEGTDRIRAVAQLLVRPTTAGRSVVYVPHGPLWPRGEPDGDHLFGVLLDGLVATARARRTVVIKLDPRASTEGGDEPGFDGLASRHGLRRARHDLQARATRIVALRDGGPELAATWVKDERNRVRRAAREGVTTTIDRVADPTELDAFVRLLAETGERAGFQPRSAAFLGRLARELASGGAWYLTLARWQGRPIAGVVTPRIGDRAFYLYGASSRDPALRHAYGSDAAMAAAMTALAADAVRSLDMWGVAEAGDEEADPAWAGFSLFKRRFGGRPIRHPGTFDLVVDRPLYVLRDARERLADAIGRSR